MCGGGAPPPFSAPLRRLQVSLYSLPLWDSGPVTFLLSYLLPYHQHLEGACFFDRMPKLLLDLVLVRPAVVRPEPPAPLSSLSPQRWFSFSAPSCAKRSARACIPSFHFKLVLAISRRFNPPYARKSVLPPPTSYKASSFPPHSNFSLLDDSFPRSGRIPLLPVFPLQGDCCRYFFYPFVDPFLPFPLIRVFFEVCIPKISSKKYLPLDFGLTDSVRVSILFSPFLLLRYPQAIPYT